VWYRVLIWYRENRRRKSYKSNVFINVLLVNLPLAESTEWKLWAEDNIASSGVIYYTLGVGGVYIPVLY